MSLTSKNHPPQLRRVLGPVDATCIVIGAIIGVGIFFSPGQVARIAGSGSLTMLAWGVGGLIALLGALTFAELGALYPRTAGQYRILKDSYGPLPAFLYVFCNATAIQAGAIAIIALVCANYLGVAVGKEFAKDSAAIRTLAVLIICSLVMINILGVKWGSRIQNFTVFAKLLTLLVITAVALFYKSEIPPLLEPESSTPNSNGMPWILIIFAAIVPAFFAFGGWQQALWMGGEIRKPERTIPVAIVAGVIVVVISYLLVNWAYLELLGYEGVVNSQSLASDAVSGHWPTVGKRLIAGAVAFSAFGVLNAQFLAGPRLIYGMARDGRFFKIFGKTSGSFNTPLEAILLLGALSLIILLSAGEDAIDKLTTGVVFIDGVFFVLTGVALFILRSKRPDATRPIRVPLYPIIPLLYVTGHFGILCGAALDSSMRKMAIIGGIWILIASGFYFVFFRNAAHHESHPEN